MPIFCPQEVDYGNIADWAMAAATVGIACVGLWIDHERKRLSGEACRRKVVASMKALKGDLERLRSSLTRVKEDRVEAILLQLYLVDRTVTLPNIERELRDDNRVVNLPSRCIDAIYDVWTLADRVRGYFIGDASHRLPEVPNQGNEDPSASNLLAGYRERAALLEADVEHLQEKVDVAIDLLDRATPRRFRSRGSPADPR